MVKWLDSWHSTGDDNCMFGIDIYVTKEGKYPSSVIIISWLTYNQLTTIW
jgi:hypothetical protein